VLTLAQCRDGIEDLLTGEVTTLVVQPVSAMTSTAASATNTTMSDVVVRMGLPPSSERVVAPIAPTSC
jgi:hypothetical protein